VSKHGDIIEQSVEKRQLETRQGLIDMITNDIAFVDMQHVTGVVPGGVISIEITTDYNGKTGVGSMRN
jgi:hypothetical protein